MLGKAFDPIWKNHKKDFTTVFRYLLWSGRINYLVFFICSYVLLNYYLGFEFKDNQMWLGVLALFLPIFTFFYYFLVNRVYWSLLPMNRKNWGIKIILSLWLVIYFLFTIFNLFSFTVSPLFVGGGLLSYSKIISYIVLLVGLLGEFIFREFSRRIKQNELEIGEIYEKTGINKLLNK